MGRVWRAHDEVLHRDVAIKELVPPPGLTDDERRELRERSLREARAIAQLNHVNVVRVFDVLRTDGDPWIVMEYVPSRSLQDILAEDGPLPPAKAAEIGLGVVGALRAAHRAGVVHRDVKPGNVLLGTDGRVLLTDFGLATIPGDPTITRSGLVLGSPAYIAPERAREGRAGPEADLWSLGALLFAAVEGHSPYLRETAIATLAALASEPPPASKNAGPLRPVLNGLLRKDPAARISLDDADRLLRRAAGRRGRGISLLEGARRPSPFGAREARTRVVPAPRPADGAAVAGAAAGVPVEEVSHAPAADAAPAAAAPSVPAGRAAGSAPVPVPGALDGGGRQDRRKRLIIALVALLALGFVLAVALLDRQPGRDRGAQPGSANQTGTAAPGPSEAASSSAPQATTSATSPAASPAQPPPRQTNAPGSSGQSGQPATALPPGWHVWSDPTGFKVPVPDGWTASRGTESYGPQVYFNGPGERRLMVDQTWTQVQSDALADLQSKEANKRTRAQDYQRVGEIRRVEGYFYDAADWDWLETINDVRVHVRARNFITTPGKQAYQIQFRLPVEEWNRVGEAQFNTITEGFVARR